MCDAKHLAFLDVGCAAFAVANRNSIAFLRAEEMSKKKSRDEIKHLLHYHPIAALFCIIAINPQLIRSGLCDYGMRS